MRSYEHIMNVYSAALVVRVAVLVSMLLECGAVWFRTDAGPGASLHRGISRCPGMRRKVDATPSLTEDDILRGMSNLNCHVWNIENSRQLFESRDGIPPGVQCEETQWCDSTSCSRVCKRGSVRIPAWIREAHRFQHRISSSLPLCYSSWFGTHNSAITLADGYGNLDPVYESMFEYISWLTPIGSSTFLRTNDQYLSLTDQLNIGVRMVEIDTHWVEGFLRVAHCGGLHVDALNKLVEALNLVAKFLGYDIRWDTETVGCNPSLSSIPSNYQRTLLDAFEEIRAWMDRPENQQEFLILYLDDEPDLQPWGVVPRLLRHIEDVFQQDEIFTPADRTRYTSWPSVSHLIEGGFRLLFVSASDYGKDMESMIFPRGKAVCNWFEPGLGSIDTTESECSIHTRQGTKGFQRGSLIRTPSCEIQYGPLNCDFVWKDKNSPILDESTLPRVLDCGLNVPSPDLITPERAASLIWTWAPGYPSTPDATLRRAANDTCVYVSSSDGRWRSAPCHDLDDFPIACKLGSSLQVWKHTIWILDYSGSCPLSSVFDMPRHPKENAALKRLLSASSVRGAKINRDAISSLYSV